MVSEGEAATHYTTDDALTRIGFGRFQTLVLVYSGLGWVAEAFEIMLLSFVGPAVEAEWGVSGAEQGLISSVVFAGMLIGSIAGGLIAADAAGGLVSYSPQWSLAYFAGTEENTSSKTSDIVALQALSSYDLIRSTFLLWFLYLANYFAYYGVILLTSELSNGRRRCASGSHLMQPKSSDLYRDVLLTSLAEFPGLLLAALLVDRIGRKKSMGGMLLMCGAFLAPLSVQLGEGLVTTLLFCARTCIMGSFAVLYVYTPELYSASTRNTGVGITSSLGRIGSIASPLVTLGLLESCHQKEAVYGVTCALFPRETKGCQIH
ncbi:unnamed protein product [Urochloa decumbens]|uniref:Major facilitator superfamily (MFS) profile domain-containing protein n=1 Tax=Urochloa decumbens TaxID=240449 RepID=A0ABC9FWR4_9POAL